MTEMMTAPMATVQGFVDGVEGELSPRAKAVIALKAFGLSNVAIASQIGISEGGVRKILGRYDPKGISQHATETRKAYLALMFEGIAAECLSTLTPEDIRGLKPEKKVALARVCASALNDLKAKIPKEAKRAAKEVAKSLGA